MRDRLSKSPLSEPLTLSENFGIYECENFLLEGAVTSPARAYWAAHTMNFYFQIEGAAPYTAGDDFPQIMKEVCEGLAAAGFDDQAAELDGIDSVLTSIVVLSNNIRRKPPCTAPSICCCAADIRDTEWQRPLSHGFLT